MVTGKTASGFEFAVNEKILKDTRLLLEFAKARRDKSSVGELIVMEKMLGEKQFNDLCTHCEDEDGIPIVNTVSSEFSEIVEAVGKDESAKN